MRTARHRTAVQRSIRTLLAATALVAALPIVDSLAQQPAPGAQAPPGAAGRGGRGGGGAAPADYNISLRSDADKALLNRYALNQAWYTMPAGRSLGSSSAIDIDKDGRSVWVAERCGGQDLCAGSHVDPVIKFSPDGKVVTAFGHDMISYPHGIHVDRDGNIWVTDLHSNIDSAARGGRTGAPGAAAGVPVPPAGAQVLKFSPDGKLLLRIGTPGVYGNDATHLSQPSDVVTSPITGEVFVADGHDSPPANNRIVVYDKYGKFLRSWPSCLPTDARQIDCSHSLAMDSQGRIFSGHRGEGRIDIFDQNGKLLDMWKQFGRGTGVYIDKNDTLYAADSGSNAGQGNAYVRGVHIGSAKTGEVTGFIPDALGNPAPWNPLRGTSSPEGVAADIDGRIYISGVTPPGLGRYTVNTNTKPAPQQGGGRGGAAQSGGQ
jgi:streptogramin lyase